LGGSSFSRNECFCFSWKPCGLSPAGIVDSNETKNEITNMQNIKNNETYRAAQKVLDQLRARLFNAEKSYEGARQLESERDNLSFVLENPEKPIIETKPPAHWHSEIVLCRRAIDKQQMLMSALINDLNGQASQELQKTVDKHSAAIKSSLEKLVAAETEMQDFLKLMEINGYQVASLQSNRLGVVFSGYHGRQPTYSNLLDLLRIKLKSMK
jgi:gas vesicle protein